MSSSYDIAIIGLGPAGATLARLISKDFRVICIDKKSDEKAPSQSFSKPCGGLLAPDAQEVLARFGLTLPKSVLADPQTFSVKTVDINTRLIRHYPRDYINTDRHRLDLWFISQIEGCEIFKDSRVSKISRENGGFRVDFHAPEGKKSVFARYVVGADGANSIVRRSFFKGKIRQYVAIQKWYEGVSNPFYCCFFDKGITDCYAWSKPQDGFTIIGAALPKNHPGELFDRLVESVMPFGFSPLGRLAKTEACLVSRPKSIFDIRLENDGAFLIGEAAGFVSPSSLEGISSAMKSAKYLADAFKKKNSAASYRAKAFRLRLKIAVKLLKLPFMYNPLLRRMVMLSRITALKTEK